MAKQLADQCHLLTVLFLNYFMLEILFIESFVSFALFSSINVGTFTEIISFAMGGRVISLLRNLRLGTNYCMTKASVCVYYYILYTLYCIFWLFISKLFWNNVNILIHLVNKIYSLHSYLVTYPVFKQLCFKNKFWLKYIG
jgi:hypothetical protein